MKPFRLIVLLVVVLSQATAQPTYQKPPKEVLDLLNAPATPTASVSPRRERLLLVTTERYPSIADLAQPMLRLAGQRINPNTNGPHRVRAFVALRGENLRVADRAHRRRAGEIHHAARVADGTA